MNSEWTTGIIAVAATVLALLAGCTQIANPNPVVCNGEERPTSRTFLQQVSDTGAIIKWRGDADAVCFGEDLERLTIRVEAVDEGQHKLARISDLEPDTAYYYSIGGAARGRQGQRFRTAPRTGELPEDGNIRIWILGDSGTAAETDDEGVLEHAGEALAVRDGAYAYIREQGGNEPIDVLLLLGDSAYPTGSDPQWQEAFFDIYPDLIKKVPTLPTIGNHEMGMGELDICLFMPVPGCEKGPVVMLIGGASMSADPASYDSDGDGPDEGGLPYLEIFTLPADAEQGGVPSGTEQYYSVDHGNVHIVSLDSQLSSKDPAQLRAMRDWLVDDLTSNELDWTVVIFHHPSYSKGKNHDSDLEQSEIDMRETFSPVFDDHGVDVVYSGHSHAYERSWYLGGHYGYSSTFDAGKHAELDSAGDPTFGLTADPYPQVSRTSGADDKVVYTVSGSSGHVSGPYKRPCAEGQVLGCATPDQFQHPAHRTFEKLADDYRPHAIERIGSVVLDATADSLTSRFVDDHGEVLDYFIIRK